MRIGVVGAGYWGTKHIRVFHELEDVELYMVCDKDPANLENLNRYYSGVRTTTDLKEMLESDVDAVVIATPVLTHFELAKEFLMAGKHVLVEKPLTTDSSSARELVELAEQRGLFLMVGHTYQFHPAVDYIKEFLQSGELGDLYYMDSARLNLGVFRPDVNVLWDLAPHDISIILYLLDENPSWISAKTTAHVNPAIAEVSYIAIGFPGNILTHTHVSWLDPCKVRRLTLVGSKRMIVFDDVAPDDSVRIYDKGASLSNGANGTAGPAIQYRYGEVRAPYIPYSEPLKNECAHFIHCIRSGEMPKSNGRDALKIISILEAAHVSMADGGRQVELEAPKAAGAQPNKSDRPSIISVRG